jgi:hypothetical protein
MFAVTSTLALKYSTKATYAVGSGRYGSTGFCVRLHGGALARSAIEVPDETYPW